MARAAASSWRLVPVRAEALSGTVSLLPTAAIAVADGLQCSAWQGRAGQCSAGRGLSRSEDWSRSGTAVVGSAKVAGGVGSPEICRMHRRGSTARTDAVRWRQAPMRHDSHPTVPAVWNRRFAEATPSHGSHGEVSAAQEMSLCVFCPSVFDSCAIAGRIVAAAAKSRRGRFCVG